MKPIIVMPMHDPTGLFFPHLQKLTPQLKEIFAQAFVSTTAITRQQQADHVRWLETDPFFQTLHHSTEILPGGDDFVALYRFASTTCDPSQILHLCFIDRLAFALQSDYRRQFIEDIQTATQNHIPLIFQRSETAWATHPQNYYELEQMMTKTGQLVLNKKFDFAWCHLVVQASQLQKILPHIKNHDISVMAEMVLLLKDKIQTRDVDWLAWEDPFILDRNPQQLKEQRERSHQETQKRLSYVIPTLQLLKDIAGNNE